MDSKSLPFAWLMALSQANKEELFARIKSEHRQIPGGPGDETSMGQCRTGAGQLHKCRYTNIPCLETTRVVLRDMPADQDFTHANFVRFSKAPCVFIAAMAPENDSIGVFWTLIWNEKVDMIICLTDLAEKGKPKTAKYWPDYDEEFEIEDLRVRMEEVNKTEGFRCTTLNVRQMRSREMRFIEHIIYKDWLDHKGPSCTHMVLSIIERIIQNAPRCTLVHCSAGIGRTGTFIALVRLVTQVNSGEAPDIPAAVKTVRSMRPWAVQACIQYTFLYWAMVVHILQKVDITNAEKFVLHEKLSYLKTASSGSLCTIPLRSTSPAGTAEKGHQKQKKKKLDRKALSKAGEFLDKSLRMNACRLRDKLFSPKRSLTPTTPNQQPASGAPSKPRSSLGQKVSSQKLSWNEKDKEEAHRAILERPPAGAKEQAKEHPLEKPQEGTNEAVAEKAAGPNKKQDEGTPGQLEAAKQPEVAKKPEAAKQDPADKLQEEAANEAAQKKVTPTKKPDGATPEKQVEPTSRQPDKLQEGANEKPSPLDKKPAAAAQEKQRETDKPPDKPHEAAAETAPNANKKESCKAEKAAPTQGDLKAADDQKRT